MIFLHCLSNVYYSGGIYDQQDATNSQYLLLEMFYMFRVIIAHHQELGSVCAAVRHYTQHYTTKTPYLEYSRLKREPHTYTPYGCTYSSELLMMGNDGPKHVEHF
jgi:deoxyribodipyrimidine photolyase-like uncharacterized protein